jgi:hypothetical protein
LGSLKRVTVSAALNANTNPTLALEWFVDGVKSNQTGRIFEFTPTAVGNFVLQAKVGNVLSNTITVAVGQGGLAVETAKFADADTIELKAPGGATVTVAGHEVADTSYYSLATGTYVIDLKKAVTQGTQVTVNLTGADGKSISQQVTYDTREFELDEFTFDGEELEATNGVYKIVKPFDAGTTYRKSYQVSFAQKNILPSLSTGTPVAYRTRTSVPTGSTAVPESTSLITELQDLIVNVDSTKPSGLYVYNISLGAKEVEIKVEIITPVAEIVLEKEYSYTETVNLKTIDFELAYVTSPKTSYVASDAILPNAEGVYVITKPFETYTDSFREIKFNFLARNFAKPDFSTNQVSVSVTGPSLFSTTPGLLFSGIETTQGSNGNAAVLTALQNLSFAYSGTDYLATTAHLQEVVQKIDHGTPTGLYTFRVSAGAIGSQTVKEVKVEIRSPAPALNFALTSLSSSYDQDLAVADLGLVTRNQVVGGSGDLFVVEKPMNDSTTFNLGWYTILSNYQSRALTANDFAEVTADSLVTNLDNRKLFNDTTKILSAVDFRNADLLVKRGVTTATEIKVKVIATATTISFAGPAAGTGSGKVADAGADVGFTTGVFNHGGLKVTLAGTTSFADRLVGTEYELSLGTYETELAAQIATFATINITGAVLSLGGTSAFKIQVSDYPTVAEFGSNRSLTPSTFYRFVNVGLSVTGPSRLIEDFTTTRAAIRLGTSKNTVVLFNQTGQDISFTGVPLAQNDGVKYTDPDDILTDGLGFNRRLLPITSSTVAGIYTLRFVVDELVREVKIQINNPQPKVFVLSGRENVDDRDDDVLKNNAVPTLNRSTVFTNLVQYASGSNSFNYKTSGVGFEQLQVYDNDGILPGVANFVPSALDRFVSAVDGVYTVVRPSVQNTAKDFLFAQIGVVDLAKGEYDYAITKKYPDGRVETFSDKVKVTALDNNQLVEFDSSNTKFINNWKVFETNYALGKHEYTFTVANVTKTFTVDVVQSQSVKVGNINFSSVGDLPLVDGNYTVSVNSIPKNTVTATPIKRTVKLEIDSLVGLKETNYYKVISSTPSLLNNPNAPVRDALGFSAGSSAATDISTVNDYTSLEDLEEINLGTISRANNDNPIVAGTYVTYTIRFYNEVNKSVDASGYQQVGSDLMLNVLFTQNPSTIFPYITVKNDGNIVKGYEANEVLTVTLFGDTFWDGSGTADGRLSVEAAGQVTAINSGKVDFPAGVTISKVIYVNPNTIQLVLSGNASSDYLAALDSTVSIPVEVLNGYRTTDVDNRYHIDYEGAILPIVNTTTVTDLTTPVTTDLFNPIGVYNTLVEGAEGGEEIIIVLDPAGTAKFKTDIDADDLTFTGFPAGTVVTGATLALDVSEKQLTITLAGGADSTVDYDNDLQVTITVAKTHFLPDGTTAATADRSFTTFLKATVEAAPAAPTSLVETDAATNTLAFNVVTGFLNAENYEISINGGVTWVTLVDNGAATTAVGNALETGSPVTSITVFVGATAIAVGNVQVRVRAGAVAGNTTLASVVRTPAGAIASSDAAYTAG